MSINYLLYILLLCARTSKNSVTYSIDSGPEGPGCCPAGPGCFLQFIFETWKNISITPGVKSAERSSEFVTQSLGALLSSPWISSPPPQAMAVKSPTLRNTNTHRRLPWVDMPLSCTTSPPQTWLPPMLLVACSW